MRDEHKEKLSEYLQKDIVITSISYLRVGHISHDRLSVQYYRKEGVEWYLVTDTIEPNGEVKTQQVRTNKPD